VVGGADDIVRGGGEGEGEGGKVGAGGGERGGTLGTECVVKLQEGGGREESGGNRV